MVRIDSHHHLWDPARGDYTWMARDSPLNRPYLLDELDQLCETTNVHATVVVQAAATFEESIFLMDLACRDSRIAGVVGWVDLDRPLEIVEAAIDELSCLGPLVGIRPMIYYLEDASWLGRPQVGAALEMIADRDLTFDLLCLEHQLSDVTRALSMHKRLRLVVNHLAKPNYTTVTNLWRETMTALADRPEAYCKVSGMVTDVTGWTIDTFRAHVVAAAEIFGPSQLMYGSDWPVSLLGADLKTMKALAIELTSELSEAEANRFWGLAAAECYRLRLEDLDREEGTRPR